MAQIPIKKGPTRKIDGQKNDEDVASTKCSSEYSRRRENLVDGVVLPFEVAGIRMQMRSQPGRKQTIRKEGGRRGSVRCTGHISSASLWNQLCGRAAPLGTKLAPARWEHHSSELIALLSCCTA